MFELTKLHKQRQQNKIKVYDSILADCHKKIYNVAKLNNKAECVFTVPAYSFGLPHYSRDACLAHVLIKLRKNGFSVVYKKPDQIQISWEKHKQTYFYDPNVLLIENNPNKSNEVFRKLNKTLSAPEQTTNPSTNTNTKFLYKQPTLQHDDNFIERSSGTNSTTYVTKFYKELNENLLL